MLNYFPIQLFVTRPDISLTVFTDIKHMNSSAGISDLGMAKIFDTRRSQPWGGGGGKWGAGVPGRLFSPHLRLTVPVQLMGGWAEAKKQGD